MLHDFNFSIDERILSIDDVPDNRTVSHTCDCWSRWKSG
jgi:hypothetical protein